MKEIVDKILNGSIEELTGEGFVFAIRKYRDYIEIFPMPKEYVTQYSAGQKIMQKDLREFGRQLVELAEELDTQTKFIQHKS